jgi:hypothetical protein
MMGRFRSSWLTSLAPALSVSPGSSTVSSKCCRRVRPCRTILAEPKGSLNDLDTGCPSSTFCMTFRACSWSVVVIVGFLCGRWLCRGIGWLSRFHWVARAAGRRTGTVLTAVARCVQAARGWYADHCGPRAQIRCLRCLFLVRSALVRGQIHCGLNSAAYRCSGVAAGPHRLGGGPAEAWGPLHVCSCRRSGRCRTCGRCPRTAAIFTPRSSAALPWHQRRESGTSRPRGHAAVDLRHPVAHPARPVPCAARP